MHKVPRVNLADPSIEPTDDELHALMTAVRDKVVARNEAASARFFERLKNTLRGRSLEERHPHAANTFER